MILGAVGIEYAVRVALAIRCRDLAYFVHERHMLEEVPVLLSMKAIEEDKLLVEGFNIICQDFKLKPDEVDGLKSRIFLKKT